MQNNQQHFTLLLQQNRRIIYSVISRYFDDHHEKEDLFQEVATQAWKSFGAFRGESQFSTWVYQIARNTSVTAMRRLKTKIETIAFSNCLFDIDIADHNEEYKEPPSIPILDTLTIVEKRTLGYILDGLNYREISAITGESTNRIAVRMHRIKKTLSNELKWPDQE